MFIMSINLDKRFSVTVVGMIIPRTLEFVKAGKRFGRVSVGCQEAKILLSKVRCERSSARVILPSFFCLRKGETFLIGICCFAALLIDDFRTCHFMFKTIVCALRGDDTGYIASLSEEKRYRETAVE